MAKKHHGRRGRGVAGLPSKKVSPRCADLMREFNADIAALDAAQVDSMKRLRNRFARRLAEMDGVDPDDGWALDGNRMTWVKLPQVVTPPTKG